MLRVASIARITAIVVSAFYMALLLPHLGGIAADHFKSAWFLGAAMVALAWIPLLSFGRVVGKDDSVRYVTFSMVPLLLMLIYFGALFAVA